MQPSPIAETSRPLFPSLRFFMLKISQESGTQETKSFCFLTWLSTINHQLLTLLLTPI